MASMTALRGLEDELNSRFVLAGLALVIALVMGLQFQAVQEPLKTNASSRVQVELTVDSPGEDLSRSVSMPNGSSVLHVLNSAYVTDYSESSMGYYVTSIGNVSSNSTHFWLYFVDNETPDVGVGQYRLNSSANVTFRLLNSSETDKYME